MGNYVSKEISHAFFHKGFKTTPCNVEVKHYVYACFTFGFSCGIASILQKFNVIRFDDMLICGFCAPIPSVNATNNDSMSMQVSQYILWITNLQLIPNTYTDYYIY